MPAMPMRRPMVGSGTTLATGRLAVATTSEASGTSIDQPAMGVAWSGRELRAALNANRQSVDFMAAGWVLVNGVSLWESTMRAGMAAIGGDEGVAWLLKGKSFVARGGEEG